MVFENKRQEEQYAWGFLSWFKCQLTSNWLSSQGINFAHAREEVIDLWHFIIQISLELDMSPNDILDEYLKKNQVNKERQ